MYCKNCGCQIDDKALYCKKCGMKIERNQEAGGKGQPEAETEPKGKRISVKRLLACVFGTITVGVVAAVIVLAVMDRKQAENQAVSGTQEQMKTEDGHTGESEEKDQEASSFAERAYELTDEQKIILQEEMNYASHHVTYTADHWSVEMDSLPDRSILWLSMDVMKACMRENRNYFDGMTAMGQDLYNADYEMDVDSFLTYIKTAFGRTMTRQDVTNQMMGIYLRQEGDCFWTDGSTPEDMVGGYIVIPMITEARQISEDRVRISGDYTGGLETDGEILDTFESEWEIDQASPACGLRLKSLEIHIANPWDGVTSSWAFQDNAELLTMAVYGSIYGGSGPCEGGVADITEGNMMPLLRDLLLRNNLLQKEIHGDLGSSGSGEAYADFTKEELEDFCEHTLGCGFTEMIRGNFEENDGNYRLKCYMGDYGDMGLEYLGNGTVFADGTAEFSGSFYNCGESQPVKIRVHVDEQSLFDGYVVDSIYFE